MKSIVISLKTAEQRRLHIQDQFGGQNIDFSFFDALTPDLALPLAQEMQLNIENDSLTNGELACFMSHVSVWQKMVDENIQHLAIFEDDVYLGENADYYLNDDNWIDLTWDIIKLEAFSKKILHVYTGFALKNNRKIFKLLGRHVGAAGYILSFKAAKYLLSLIKNNKITEPLDHIVFDPKYHGEDFPLYQMKPALCIQGYLYLKSDENLFRSALENQRIVRRKGESRSRTIYEKIYRELVRFKQQINTSLFKKRIYFK